MVLFQCIVFLIQNTSTLNEARDFQTIACLFFDKLSNELINHPRRLQLRSLVFISPPLIPETFLASISGFTRLLSLEGGGAWDTTGSPCQEVFWESTFTDLFAASIN